jgi:hypothetical protein
MSDRRVEHAGYPGGGAWGYGAPQVYGAPTAASPTGDLVTLADLHARGVIDEAELASMKQRVVAP